VLGVLILAILVVLILAEERAAARRRARGEPSPLERLNAETAGAGAP
jgi:hypothetical protein